MLFPWLSFNKNRGLKLIIFNIINPATMKPLRMKFISLCIIGVLVTLGSCRKNDEPPTSTINPDTIVVRIESAKTLGPLSMPASMYGRDGGQSALIGGKSKWIFGDSFFDRYSEDGINYRTNTSSECT
jgi:hypothetical protein